MRKIKLRKKKSKIRLELLKWLRRAAKDLREKLIAKIDPYAKFPNEAPH